MSTRLTVALLCAAPLALLASAAGAAPQRQVATCSGGASSLPLAHPEAAYSWQSLPDTSITLPRVADFRMPFGDRIPRWAGEGSIALDSGYTVSVRLTYMPSTPAGDFVVDEPALTLVARLLHQRPGNHPPEVIAVSSGVLEASAEQTAPSIRANLIDTQLDAYLYRLGVRADRAAGGVEAVDYWPAIRDHVAAQNPGLPMDPYEAFVRSFWPKVVQLLAPLRRDAFYPSVTLSCSIEGADAS